MSKDTQNSIRKYNLSGEFVEDFNTVTEIIHKYPDIDPVTMNLVLTGQELFLNNHFWIRADKSDKVSQLVKAYGNPIIAISLDKKASYRYSSIEEAARMLNLDPSRISQAMNDREIYKGLAWFHAKDEAGLSDFENEFMIYSTFAKEKLFRISTSDGHSVVYNTILEGAKGLDENPHTVYIWLHDGPSIKVNTDYTLEYIDEYYEPKLISYKLTGKEWIPSSIPVLTFAHRLTQYAKETGFDSWSELYREQFLPRLSKMEHLDYLYGRNSKKTENISQPHEPSWFSVKSRLDMESLFWFDNENFVEAADYQKPLLSQVQYDQKIYEAIEEDVVTSRSINSAVAGFMTGDFGEIPDCCEKINKKHIQEVKGLVAGVYPSSVGLLLIIASAEYKNRHIEVWDLNTAISSCETSVLFNVPFR